MCSSHAGINVIHPGILQAATEHIADWIHCRIPSVIVHMTQQWYTADITPGSHCLNAESTITTVHFNGDLDPANTVLTSKDVYQMPGRDLDLI